MRAKFLAFSVGTPFLAVALAQYWPAAWWLIACLVPLIGVGIYDLVQPYHALRRNYPLFGRGRWLMEGLRPFVRQYLLESDTDGAPINRMFRSIVYQRAKGELETVPFGTQVDTYRTGYEWIGHSLSAIDAKAINADLRVTVGGPQCTQPYSASIFNISAMSFGALSRNAILALNGAARDGNFYHNTGEGGISPYHLESGGDLIWQIGTAYFGCRDDAGQFEPKAFAETATRSQVKMIEVKLSQGAIRPDFITVDGGEGGTGAAPLEYVNSVGMPLREALAFVDDSLTGFGLRQDIRLIASGKILTGFHLVKNLALGADICNSARGMMLALGCVQSLTCNSNHCPTGVATQDPRLYRGLVVTDKRQRVLQYHHKTVHITAELIASAGLHHTSELTRTHIYRRVSQETVRRYDQIFPYLKSGSLLTKSPPDAWHVYLDEADVSSFAPKHCLTEIEKQCCEVT